MCHFIIVIDNPDLFHKSFSKKLKSYRQVAKAVQDAKFLKNVISGLKSRQNVRKTKKLGELDVLLGVLAVKSLSNHKLLFKMRL